MSSILKALKKIEEDSPPPKTYPSLPNPIDSKQAHDSDARRRRRRRLILFVLLLVIAFAAVRLFNQRRPIVAKIISVLSSEPRTDSETSTADNGDVYRAKVPSPSPKPVRKSPPVSRQIKKQKKRTVPGSGDNKIQTGTQSGRPRSSTARRSTQPSNRKRVPETAGKSGAIKPRQGTSQATASSTVKTAGAPQTTRPNTPATGTKRPTRPKSRENYDRLVDPKLKLQALAWSDDKNRRMAVINGRIVHEGESVDGYQVITIRQDDIIVKEGRKSWRLEFGLQQ